MVLENLNINAGVAQLAAQLICNQSAIGSSPITSSIISARMAVVISLANLLYFRGQVRYKNEYGPMAKWYDLHLALKKHGRH